MTVCEKQSAGITYHDHDSRPGRASTVAFSDESIKTRTRGAASAERKRP